MSGAGYGAGAWGGMGWGDADTVGAGALTLLSVLAVSENVVLYTFSAPVLFTGLFDAGDAGDPLRYALAPDPTTTGYDGQPPRPVGTVLAALADGDGSGVLVTLDRPLSPWPSSYFVSAEGVQSADGTQSLAPGGDVLPMPGVARALVPNNPSAASPARLRDVANPFSGLDASALGVFPVDASGDYAFDQGDDGLRKRALRRLVTRKSAFAHLPGYGVGALAYVKKLATKSARDQLSGDAEKQLAQEPDVSKASVTLASDAARPELTRVAIRLRTTAGADVSLNDLALSGS
jgi:hypothetical protein